MKWKNNLKEQIKEQLATNKVAIPSDIILKSANCNKIRFYKLLNNNVTMTAWELIIFSDWLNADPRDMVSLKK